MPQGYVTIEFKSMTKEQFAEMIEKSSQGLLARIAGKLEAQADNTAKAEKPYKHVVGTNGLINYRSGTGGIGEESEWERKKRERFWRSLGKKIRKGARVKGE